ncbi:hypothetical protein M408DRAFT_327390 [Serendipita vermifera MAFF 305830]|uniref:Uncharacterized protein n=1 Tax=Serendipita vermifera MAFF 305830 TaxID=933852 RepID=A0A0C3BIU1_SERVB|nr:hypothetical protein M408DRAFT_327390 [Serendipita vermifera MAFF 305830]
MESQRRRTKSPPPRRRRSRSLSPPPRGSRGPSRRELEKKRDQRGGYQGHHRTESSESYKGSSRKPWLDPSKRRRESRNSIDYTTRPEEPTRNDTTAPEAPKARLPSHSRTSSGVVEDLLVMSPITENVPQTVQITRASSPLPIITTTTNPTSQQAEYLKPIQRRVDGDLERRDVSQGEREMIHAIWDRRVGTLGKLQDILMKKDELSAFLEAVKKARPIESESDPFQQFVERLDRQIQDANDLITYLWQEMLDHELDMDRVFATSEDEGRLEMIEKAMLALQSKTIMDEKSTTEVSEPLASLPGISEDSSASSLDSLNIDDLEVRLREQEDEFHELDFGFDGDDFEYIVTSVLDELRGHGRIGPLSKIQLEAEDKQALQQLEEQLASLELWAVDHESRMGQREKAESEWAAQYALTLNQIELREKAVLDAEASLQQANDRLEKAKLARISPKDQVTMAENLAEELLKESSIQMEQDWKQSLDSTRGEARSVVERSIADLKTFLAQIDAEEQANWHGNERKIFEEVAQRLEKTFKWQDAAVRWLEFVDKIKKRG